MLLSSSRGGGDDDMRWMEKMLFFIFLLFYCMDAPPVVASYTRYMNFSHHRHAQPVACLPNSSSHKVSVSKQTAGDLLTFLFGRA